RNAAIPPASPNETRMCGSTTSMTAAVSRRAIAEISAARNEKKPVLRAASSPGRSAGLAEKADDAAKSATSTAPQARIVLVVISIVMRLTARRYRDGRPTCHETAQRRWSCNHDYGAPGIG